MVYVKYITQQVISHEEYYKNGKDFALLELSQDLEWTDYVRPACLPLENVNEGATCWISGWGETEGRFEGDTCWISGWSETEGRFEGDTCWVSEWGDTESRFEDDICWMSEWGETEDKFQGDTWGKNKGSFEGDTWGGTGVSLKVSLAGYQDGTT